MYRKRDRAQMTVEDFVPPFGGKLDAENRWVIMAKLMPWDMIEDIYVKSFKCDRQDGRPPIPSRIAFGALYIKEYENLPQDRTLQHISENVYMQYFLGLTEFIPKPMFDSSMMTHFAKRFGKEDLSKVNEEIYRRTHRNEDPPTDIGGNDSDAAIDRSIDSSNGSETVNDRSNGSEAAIDRSIDSNNDGETAIDRSDDSSNGIKAAIDRSIDSNNDGETVNDNRNGSNKGTLILDATAVPSDIRYPTDLSLLNECRVGTEKIIDDLWDKTERKGHKTAYSRKKARQGYLRIAKQRKPRKKQIRQAVREQLEYVEKNVEKINGMWQTINHMDYLKHWAQFETIQAIAQQQRQHYDNPSEPIEDRIVSLSQPHVRPIVRGKARGEVEFGQKLSLSIVDGFTFIENQSWDNFAEGKTLQASAEKFRGRHGVFPKAILADKTYRNRDNINFCKKNGIRLSGPRLGRPKESEIEADKEQAYKDSCDRNTVEGKIGVGKRRFGLDLIYARGKKTGEIETVMNVLSMNVAHVLRSLLRRVLTPAKT